MVRPFLGTSLARALRPLKPGVLFLPQFAPDKRSIFHHFGPATPSNFEDSDEKYWPFDKHSDVEFLVVIQPQARQTLCRCIIAAAAVNVNVSGRMQDFHMAADRL